MLRPSWENADLSAARRDRVHELVSSDWTGALKVATEISHPWYRVQSLAEVATAAADHRVDAILEMALVEAGKDTDTYRRVAVLAWVIDAALARDRKPFAESILQDALTQSATVTPMKSRAAALELLLKRATKVGERDARQVADALLDVAATLAADPVKRWHKWGVSYVNRTARILSRDHMPLAVSLLTARFGAERSAAILARHSASRAR